MDTKEIMQLSIQKSYGDVLPLTIIVLAVATFFVVFFIKRLNCRLGYVVKLAWFNLLATAVVELLILLVGYWVGLFTIVCKTGLICPSEFRIFIMTVPYTAVPVFVFLTLFCYFVKYFSSKDEGIGYNLKG